MDENPYEAPAIVDSKPTVNAYRGRWRLWVPGSLLSAGWYLVVMRAIWTQDWILGCAVLLMFGGTVLSKLWIVAHVKGHPNISTYDDTPPATQP